MRVWTLTRRSHLPCEKERFDRARRFCDCYGLSTAQRVGLIETAAERLAALVAFMRAQAAAGHEAFIANLADGHHVLYLADIEYLTVNRRRLQAEL